MRWRRFLEPATNNVDSYIAVHIDRNTWIDLKIADCNRSIVLGFGLESPTKIKTAQAKLDTLRAGLDKIQAEIDKRQA